MDYNHNKIHNIKIQITLIIVIIIKITTPHLRIKLTIMVAITKINITINNIITSKYLIIIVPQCHKDLGTIQ